MEGCDYRDHTEPIFQEMKLLILSDIYFLEIAKFMHRIHYKQNNITAMFLEINIKIKRVS